MAPAKGKRWRIPAGFEAAFVEFQTVPNIGKAMAEDLVRLRIRGIKGLARQNAMSLYNAISRLDGVRHDPCVLDTFMAAVEFAKTGTCKPWWKYTPERKAMLAAAAKPQPRGTAARSAASVPARRLKR